MIVLYITIMANPTRNDQNAKNILLSQVLILMTSIASKENKHPLYKYIMCSKWFYNHSFIRAFASVKATFTLTNLVAFFEEPTRT